ncbi:MAG: HEAT repeat domain-containing protein [Verrucomicrobiota bacterium]|nr:HEAT repeat domain-containing protein [Verrucomicrobiota bacterium]
MRQWIFLSLSTASLLTASVEEGIRRVQAHLLIDDPTSALQEAEQLVGAYPESKEAGKAMVEALAALGYEEKALNEWNLLSARYPELIADRRLLEEVAWGVLKKGISSTQYGVRLGALIGSYLTHDVRAVPILLKMMRDSNAVIRSVAVQMASGYGDAALKDEVVKMLEHEKVWIVRLEVMKAAGLLRIKKVVPMLETLVQSDKVMAEERQTAIEALINIWDHVEPSAILPLAQSNRAGLRHLACAIATHFRTTEVKEEIVKLLSDTHPDVRIAALNAVGLFYREKMEAAELKEVLKPRLEENDPGVAITAGWVAMLVDSSMGEPVFEKWLNDSLSENRRLAAAALSSTGARGAALAVKALKENADPYVRANVAMGLIGQRKEVAAASDCLYEFLSTEKRMWMWDTRPNPLFQTLAPSQVRHIDQIPNYPEAIDQMTRLNLVSLLAMVEDPRATAALKSFLQRKKWGITGVAAATLLQEGDETALEVVRTLLEDSDPQVRFQACLVLAMYGKDETVLKELQGAYAGSDFETKLHILEALGNVGNPESYSFLIGVLREPFPLLRVAAAAALIQSMSR